MRRRFVGMLGIFTLICAVSADAASYYSIRECGLYEIEGYLELAEGRQNMILRVEKGTESELGITLGRYDEKNYKYDIGTKVRVRVEIRKPCTRRCDGKLNNVTKRLEPYATLRPFFGRPRACLKKLTCASD